MTYLNLPSHFKLANGLLIPSSNYQQSTESNEYGFIKLKAEDGSSITIMREPSGQFAVMASTSPILPMHIEFELDHKALEHDLNQLNPL